MFTVNKEYNKEVALNKIDNATLWNKFGYNDDIDIGTEVVWSYGGLFTRLTTASTLSFVSTSSEDNGGTGASRIVVYGIGSDRLARVEVVTLNGTTPVITTSTWLGINRLSVYLCGTSDSNVGTITATATSNGSIQGQIPATEGTTQQAIFFTQAGYTFLLDLLSININKISGGSSPVCTVKGFVYSFISNSKYEIYRNVIDTSVVNNVVLTPLAPFVVGESSVMWFEVTTNTNNTVANVRFSGIETKNI